MVFSENEFQKEQQTTVNGRTVIGWVPLAPSDAEAVSLLTQSVAFAPLLRKNSPAQQDEMQETP